MKTLVVPDVHGRKFWIEPCLNWQGSIVFLGDYHDPYFEEVSKDNSLKNLKKLVEFYESNKDRIICLLGNHDANYIIERGFADRLDYYNYPKVVDLMKRLNLQLCYQINNILFSHSGVLPEWLELYNLKLDELNNIPLNHSALRSISVNRGGVGPGGILWGDVREYILADKHIPNLYQIFGHTQLQDKPIIMDDFADLDCRQCFIVDCETKEIKLYGN